MTGLNKKKKCCQKTIMSHLHNMYSLRYMVTCFGRCPKCGHGFALVSYVSEWKRYWTPKRIMAWWRAHCKEYNKPLSIIPKDAIKMWREDR